VERLKDTEKQQILADMAAKPRKASEMMDGYMVWVQNEHLDFFVGELPSNWRKALDPISQR